MRSSWNIRPVRDPTRNPRLIDGPVMAKYPAGSGLLRSEIDADRIFRLDHEHIVCTFAPACRQEEVMVEGSDQQAQSAVAVIVPGERFDDDRGALDREPVDAVEQHRRSLAEPAGDLDGTPLPLLDGCTDVTSGIWTHQRPMTLAVVCDGFRGGGAAAILNAAVARRPLAVKLPWTAVARRSEIRFQRFSAATIGAGSRVYQSIRRRSAANASPNVTAPTAPVVISAPVSRSSSHPVTVSARIPSRM